MSTVIGRNKLALGLGDKRYRVVLGVFGKVVPGEVTYATPKFSAFKKTLKSDIGFYGEYGSPELIGNPFANISRTAKVDWNNVCMHVNGVSLERGDIAGTTIMSGNMKPVGPMADALRKQITSTDGARNFGIRAQGTRTKDTFDITKIITYDFMPGK
jgi:hypothetical protein